MVELAQGAGGAGGKKLPRRRKRDAARAPLDQRRAEVIFEVLDLPADGGGRDMQVFSRRPH